MGARHYIGMAGLHGCLPQTCASYDTYRSAVDSLAQTHDLGKNRAGILLRESYLELNIRRDGNEYCEIIECDCDCDCDTPEVHNDG